MFAKNHQNLLPQRTVDLKGLADVVFFCHLSLESSSVSLWLGLSTVTGTNFGEKRQVCSPSQRRWLFPLLLLASPGQFVLLLLSGCTLWKVWLRGPGWNGKWFCKVSKSFLWTFVNCIYATIIYRISNWQDVVPAFKLLLIQWRRQKAGVFKPLAKCENRQRKHRVVWKHLGGAPTCSEVWWSAKASWGKSVFWIKTDIIKVGEF